MSWPWGAYLGETALENGITACISSWKRVGPNTIPHASKASGVYLNSMLATTEARRGGYDEGILLTDDGFVADGPGENIFVVKNGVIRTPPLSTSILPGLTRDAVITIAQDLGYVVEETPLIRSDLYLADEFFMTGTAAEVTPVRAVDDQELGVGPVTREIQTALPRHRQRPERPLGALARRRRGGRSGLAADDLSRADALRREGRERREGRRRRGPGRRRSAPSRSAGRGRARRGAADTSPPYDRVAGEDRLQVHRLPHGPRLDVLAPRARAGSPPGRRRTRPGRRGCR